MYARQFGFLVLSVICGFCCVFGLVAHASWNQELTAYQAAPAFGPQREAEVVTSAPAEDPLNEWIRIAGGKNHRARMEVKSGWTFITLEIAGKQPLNVLVYDQAGNRLGVNRYEGGVACGLGVYSRKPQMLTIVVENRSDASNACKLHLN